MITRNCCFIENTVNNYIDFAQYINTNSELNVYGVDDSQLYCNNSQYDRLCFIFHTKDPGLTKFLNNEPLFSFQDLLLYKNLKSCSQNFKLMINTIKKLKVKNIDFLACDLLLYDEWKRFFEILTELTSVIVGASSDRTGNIKYGGDWILESTGEDIRDIYFNNKIINYTDYLLISNTDDGLTTNIDIGGTFSFNGNNFTTCNASSNGFVYFSGLGTGIDLPNETKKNPLYHMGWRNLSPFGGDLKTTATGIVCTNDTINHTSTITFNCYSNATTTTNTLVFGVILYLSNHATKANQVDFFYTSSTSRTNGFTGNYYIGCVTGNTSPHIARYVTNTDTMALVYGNGYVTSTNIFPANNTTLSNVMNTTPTGGILTNGENAVTQTEMSIGGSITIGGGTYTTCGVSSNGFIMFGEYQYGDTTDPRGYSSYRNIAPFAGHLRMTNNGVTMSTSNNICTITFDCYSNSTSTANTLNFSILLYLSGHANANRIDFVYNSSTSRTSNFSGDYVIFFSTSTVYGCAYNADTPHLFATGTSAIASTNIFPANGTTVTNVTTSDLTVSGLYLLNSDDNTYSINLGGTFVCNSTSYTTCSISTNGFIYFGSGPTASTTAPLNNTSWITVSGFANDLKVTQDGIKLTKNSDNSCTIRFNCRSWYDNPNNLLIWEKTIFYNNHATKPNIIEIKYISALAYSGSTFGGNYYIGFRNNSYVKSMINTQNFITANAEQSISSLIYPANGTTYYLDLNNNVLKIKSNITWNPETITDTYKTKLTSNQLNASVTVSGTTSNPSGTIEYKLNSTSGTIVTTNTSLNAGTFTLYCIFIPTSSIYIADYVTNSFTINSSSNALKFLSSSLGGSSLGGSSLGNSGNPSVNTKMYLNGTTKFIIISTPSHAIKVALQN